MSQNRPATSASRWSSRNLVAAGVSHKGSLKAGTEILRELKEMAEKLNLDAPVYKIAGGTSSGHGFFCSVNVHGHLSGSLDEYASPEQAKCAAAQNAVKLLKTYYADKLLAIAESHFADSTFKNVEKSSDSSQTNDGASKSIKSELGNETTDQRPNDGYTDEFERVAEKLLYLLIDMPRGIYSHALSLKYLETYKQNLPTDWLNRIRESYPEFVVDDVDAFRSVVAKRRLRTVAAASASTAQKSVEHDGRASLEKLRINQQLPAAPTTPASLPTDVPSTTTKQDSMSQSLSTVKTSVEEKVSSKVELNVDKPKSSKELITSLKQKSNTKLKRKVQFNDRIDEKEFTGEANDEIYEIIQAPPMEHPPPFSLPEEPLFEVYISVVKTPCDFMFRVIGYDYSTEYEELQRLMHGFYETDGLGHKLNVSLSDIGSYETLLGGVFAAKAEDCWHRVYVHEIIAADEGIADENGVMASTYFIDHGDYENIRVDDLRVLEQPFMRLPCQAAAACLKGFENFENDDFTPEMYDRFRDLVLAKVLPAKHVGCMKPKDGDPDKAVVGPILLLLDLPIEAENIDAVGGAKENENSSPPKSLLVNDIIMQLVPESMLDKVTQQSAAVI